MASTPRSTKRRSSVPVEAVPRGTAPTSTISGVANAGPGERVGVALRVGPGGPEAASEALGDGSGGAGTSRTKATTARTRKPTMTPAITARNVVGLIGHRFPEGSPDQCAWVASVARAAATQGWAPSPVGVVKPYSTGYPAASQVGTPFDTQSTRGNPAARRIDAATLAR